MRLARFFPLFLLASSALLTAARAAPPTSFVISDHGASDRADELVKRGVALAKADKYAEAEPLVREAWGLKHAYDIAANLGIVEAALGKWRDAAEHVAYALSTFPANGKPEHKKLLEQTLAKAAAQIGALRIKVSADKAEVFVDGKSAGLAPLPGVVFVDPGSRTIEAKLGGYDPASQAVDVKKGDASEVTLTLKEAAPPPLPTGSASAPPPPPTATVPAPPPPWRPGVAWFATGGALAAAGLGVGIGLTVAANGKASDAAALSTKVGGRSACAGQPAPVDCASLKTTLGTQGTYASAAHDGFVAGGAFALATAGLAVWTMTAPKASGRARIVPVATATGGGLFILGTW
jgi:PEGA domain